MQKKVVVRRFTGVLAWGYLPLEGLMRDGSVEIMGVDGRVSSINMSEIKLIAYVRDFNLDDGENPERIIRKIFLGRPRGNGLWLRASFMDGAVLEGLSELGLGFLDTVIKDGGLFLTPPDLRGNTHRVFVPRSALRSLEVLGWITAPSKRPAAKPSKPSGDEAQPRLFE